MHIDWWTLGLQAANFLILAWLLRHFFYRPVLAAIDRRRAATVAARDQAAEAERRAEAAEREWRARAEELEVETAELRRHADADAAHRAQDVVAEARRQADRLLAEARDTIAAERREAADALGRHAAGVAATLAGRLLASVAPATGPAPFLVLLADRLSQLESEARSALALGPLVVHLAPALPEPEQEGWRRRLLQALGSSAELRFAVAPELVAGARLVSAGAVLEVSWAESLASAEREMGRAQPG